MSSSPPSPETRRAEFDALYQAHARDIWAVAYARWGDTDLALDIAQEAFLRLWKHWEDGGEVIVHPRAWLIRVARNLAEDHAKSAFRRNGTHPPEFLVRVRSSEIQPQEQLERSETFATLRAVLETLSPDDRELLTYRYSLEYDTDQIAELLSINPTAVHMRLSRARQRLAEKLTAQGVNPLS